MMPERKVLTHKKKARNFLTWLLAQDQTSGFSEKDCNLAPLLRALLRAFASSAASVSLLANAIALSVCAIRRHTV